MDSLNSILSDRSFDEPPEMTAIKKYVRDEFNEDVGVLIRDRDIVVLVPSSALAGTLRLRSPEIAKRCNLSKRLTFRLQASRRG
ncbi:MAG TPA: hypothetical protein VHB51_00055 [Candidatus Saccharimonadales bacterium]|nr:hypothetical protein [Candidatus Saccharimonadales bacterium]